MVEMEPELRQRVEEVATERRLSLGDYVIRVLQDAVDRRSVIAESNGGDPAWSQLSSHSFARDWESDADAIYDDMA